MSTSYAADTGRDMSASGMDATSAPNVTPAVTPTQGNGKLKVEEIKHKQEAKEHTENAEKEKTSATTQQVAGGVLSAVGGVLCAFPPIGTVIGACLLVAGIILNVTASKTQETAVAEQQAAANEEEMAANTAAEAEANKETTSAATGESQPTEASSNLANMAVDGKSEAGTEMIQGQGNVEGVDAGDKAATDSSAAA